MHHPTRCFPWPALLPAFLTIWLGAVPAAADELDAQTIVAYRAAYNLDHETALDTARAAMARWPDESRAYRTLAGILWLQAVFHRGAVTVDHYTGGLTSSTLDLPPPLTAIAAEFHTTVARAIALAETRLAQRPDDPDALYEAGAAYGVQASWIASVDGRVRGAFGMARRAFNAQEARDPATAAEASRLIARPFVLARAFPVLRTPTARFPVGRDVREPALV